MIGTLEKAGRRTEEVIKCVIFLMHLVQETTLESHHIAMIKTQTTIDVKFQNNALLDPNWFGFQVGPLVGHVTRV